MLDAFPAVEGDVLYLALEDNERRLQRRLRQMLGGHPPPARVDSACNCPRLDQGGLDQIRVWLMAHPDARLVVVDTFARVRPPRTRNRGVYDDDYACVATLKALADESSPSRC